MPPPNALHKALQALNIPALEPLTDDQRHKLAQGAKFKEYGAHTILYYKNDTPPPMLLLSGAVKLYSETAQGKERVLHIVREGKFIDLAALFYVSGSPVSAISIKNCKTLHLDTTCLTAITSVNPALCVSFLRMLAARQRFFINKLIGSQGKISVSVRVASWLLHKAKRCQQGTIPLETTLSLLASQMGISRESLSRELSALTASGYIARGKKEITLLDTKALQIRAALA